MKVSDYIAAFLHAKGMRTVFELSGGMIVHMLDSLHRRVGSETSVSIREVASSVSTVLLPPTVVRIGIRPQNEMPATRYIPSTNRARTELNLLELTALESAIARTARHYKANGCGGAAGNLNDVIAIRRDSNGSTV